MENPQIGDKCIAKGKKSINITKKWHKITKSSWKIFRMKRIEGKYDIKVKINLKMIKNLALKRT